MVKNNQKKIHFFLIVVIFLIFTIPFVSHYLFNWDAGQFALGVKYYNVRMHQPHPPGYPAFIFTGKIIDYFLNNANQSLASINIFFALLSVIFFYYLILEFFPQKNCLALVGTLLLIFNPFFWFYREIANIYCVDTFAAIFLAFIFLRVKKNNKIIFLSSIIFGLLGGFRPTMLFLLLPLYLACFVYLKKEKKKIIISLFLLILAILIWLVPMIIFSGGIAEFLKIMQNLFLSSAKGSSVFNNSLNNKFLAQIKNFILILIAAINVLIIPIALSLVKNFRKIKTIDRRKIWLFFIWLAPAVFIYLFIHFGQAGYILLILPVFIFISLTAINDWCQSILGRAIIVLLIITQACFFIFGLKINQHDFSYTWFNIKKQDDYLYSLLKNINQYDADSTLIVTSRNLFYLDKNNDAQRNSEIYRQLMYYLPNYTIIEVAPKRRYYLLGNQYQTSNIAKKNIIINGQKYTQILLIEKKIEEKNMPINLSLTKKENYYLGNLADKKRFKFLRFNFEKE